MQTISFSLSRFPRIEFGAGKIQLLPEKIDLSTLSRTLFLSHFL